MARRHHEEADPRRRELTEGWLEAQGRLLSPAAILLRFVLVMCCLGAVELGRGEGTAFGIGLLWHGACYQLLVISRLRETVLGRQESGDKRPLRAGVAGWMDVNWRLRGVVHHTLRGITTAGVVLVVLYFDSRVTIAALVVCHFGTELAGVMMGRVVDQLIQVEAERRVAVLRGFKQSEGSDRGDFRPMGG